MTCLEVLSWLKNTESKDKNMYDQLTNESLKGLFKSNFELTRYAIRLGRYYLRSGKEMGLQDVLDEIEDHPDEAYLDELQEIDRKEREEESSSKSA